MTYDETVENLVNTLIEERKRQDLSIRCVSERSGVSESTIKRYEETKKVFHSTLLFKWAKALGFYLVTVINDPS